MTSPTPRPPAPESHYTVFVRLPFPRGEFVDPPAVNWYAAKDRALWKVLSSASKGSEIDWTLLAEQFDVSLPFLLQQAAWLYERQLAQVREQLRKVNRPASSSGNSPAPGSVSGSATTAGQTIRRVGSSSRVPSALSMRARNSPSVRSETGTPVPVKAPTHSRTTSTSTVTQVPKPAVPIFSRSTPSSHPPHRSPPPNPQPAQSPSLASSTTSSSSDSPLPLARSRVFTRTSRPAPAKPSTLGPLSSSTEPDDSGSSSPTFLPFSAGPATGPSTSEPAQLPTSPHDPSATLRRPLPPATLPHQRNPSTATDTSSTSRPSAAAPLSSLSPRQRRIAREGSEGTPSMGSSFSDLDDASVTQSALESALAREILQGRGSLGVGVSGVSGVVGRVGKLWRGSGEQ